MHPDQLKRPWTSRFTPLLMLALLAEGAPAAVADDPGMTVPTAEIVYQLRKTVSLDGRVHQEEPIDRLSEVAIDLETLRDDQGLKYQIEADASQEEDGGDLTYELRLLRTA